MKRLIWPAVGLIAMLSLALLGACAGAETGNGGAPDDGPPKIEVRVTDADDLEMDTKFGALDAAGVLFEIDEAWLVIDRLDFVLSAGSACLDLFDTPAEAVAAQSQGYAAFCTQDNSMRIEGPWVYDLITGEADPPLDTLDIPDGSYRQIDAKLSHLDLLADHEADEADEPDETDEDSENGRDPAEHVGDDVVADPMEDLTVRALGEVVLADGPSLFELGLKFTVNARFAPNDPTAEIALTDGLTLVLDVRRWFADVPLSDCANAGHLDFDPDGVLQVRNGRGPCTNIKALVSAAIRDSGSLE